MVEAEDRTVVATTVAAPWGPVHLAASRSGVVAAELGSTPEAFDAGLRRRLGRSPVWLAPGDPRPALLEAAAAALAAAADGAPDAQARLDAIPLDLADRPAWDRDVLAAVRAIPRGETRSYGEIARLIGRPGAARAVGGAVGRNPVGFLVPCHRVVAGDGTLGGYGGGWWGDRDRLLDLKAELLAREGVHLPRSRPHAERGR
ncbi:MAG TPA: MGMT family protein [Candidatus Limnocylindrales bacterium]|nr:MGMT family protein [Candidatus Limnocylindrales bacterium]